MFSEWIDFGHKDTIYKLIKIRLVKKIAGDSPILPNFPAVSHTVYIVQKKQNDRLRLIISLWIIQLGF